jgi:hypothetical protein
LFQGGAGEKSNFSSWTEEMKQSFKDDFYEILKLIVESDSLALSRFADGEANILKNNTIGNKDGWLYKKDRNLVFRADLRRSLLCTDPGFIYGISCTCCDEENHRYLLDNLKTGRENLTFSNIFVNANFPLFQENFLRALAASQKDIAICTNKKARIENLDSLIPVKDFIPVPGNCVEYWEKGREYIRGLLDLKGSTFSNRIYLFAVGPLSEILIHELWRINPKNILLDIGSTLDPLLFRRKSRDYHRENSVFSNRTCVW